MRTGSGISALANFEYPHPTFEIGDLAQAVPVALAEDFQIESGQRIIGAQFELLTGPQRIQRAAGAKHRFGAHQPDRVDHGPGG